MLPLSGIARLAGPLLAAALPVCLAIASPKQDTARRLRQTEQAQAQRQQAAALSARAAAEAAAREAALADARVQAAAKLRGVEERVLDASRQLAEAEAASRAEEAAVDDRTKSLSAMLPLALRLSRSPAEMLLAAPVPADIAMEGLLATQGVATELARQVGALRAQQAKARALAAAVAQRRQALQAQQTRQTQAEAGLDRQIAQADQTEAAALEDQAVAAQSAATLAAQAKDLRGAIAAMDAAERRAALARRKPRAAQPPAGPGLGAAKPLVTLVTGSLARGWGASAEDGPASGLTFRAAPGAFVASPCAGRVAFAAPFRSYGRLMIIECGAGDDFVLAGMDRLDARLGQTLRPGEPVGRMAQTRGTGRNEPMLYVELRRNGVAVDPTSYLDVKP